GGKPGGWVVWAWKGRTGCPGRPPDGHRRVSPRRVRPAPPRPSTPPRSDPVDPAPVAARPARPRGRVRRWLLEGLDTRGYAGPSARGPDHDKHPWYKVMCLTGVDYFSTLGYQPGIAALAAGLL